MSFYGNGFYVLMHINTNVVCPAKSNTDHHQEFIYAFGIPQVRVFQIEPVSFKCLEHGFDLPTLPVVY